MATCIVTGILKDPSETALAGVQVQFNIQNPVLDNGGTFLLGTKAVSTTTDAAGSWSLTLTQDCSGILSMDIPPDGVNGTNRYEFTVSIPATPTATFPAIWVDPASANPVTPAQQLPDGQVWIGNGANLPQARSISGDATISDTGVLTLLSVGTPGTYPKVTTDAQGRVISGTVLLSVDIPNNAANTSGTAAGLSTTLAIASGGTGQTTANAAANALLPGQAGNSGKVLQTDGTNTSWGTPGSGTVTAVSVNTANGLAGSSSGGATPALTLSTTVTGVVKGNGTALSAATAGTDYSAGTSGNATGIVKSTTGTGALTTAIAADFPTLNQNTTGTAANVTGTVAIANGGTGQTAKTAAFDALQPMTASGDIIYGAASGTGTRLPKGSDTQVLTLVSGLPSWQAAGTASPLTTKGDLYTYTSTNARHGVPSDYGDLVPDATQTDGWRNAPYTATNGKQIKNYIQYADFENGATTGWSLGSSLILTNGIPTGTGPSFGSGASGNLSISVVSSGQLSGASSLALISSAATTAGNFLASSAYTIDNSDQAQVLAIKFKYKVNSGAANGNFSGTSSNSFGVAVWDATNSNWLSQAGNFNLVQTTGVGTYNGTFQTAITTASIRLVFYNANVSAGAITMYLDDFFVGPQITAAGFAGSDVVSFTPTGSWTTNTAYTGSYSRIGDKALIYYKLNYGGLPSPATTLILNLPAGLVIDTTKQVGTLFTVSAMEAATGVSTNGSGTTTGLTVLYNSSTSVLIAYESTATATLAGLTPTAPATINASGETTVSFIAPIVGWSSNTVMSSDTDTRVVSFAGSQTSQAVTANVTDIAFTANTGGNRAGAWSGTQFIVPVSGDYLVSGAIGISVASAVGDVYLNTAHYGYWSSCWTTNAVSSGSILITGAKAGDTISLRSTSTGTVTVGSLNVFRLSGPATIAATESVNARYYASATIISGSLATIVWTTKDFDTHNAMSSGIYTIPVSGKYQINTNVQVTGTIALNSVLDAQLQKNSTNVTEFQTYAGGAMTAQNAQISDTLSCLAGDTIRLQLSSAATLPVIASGNTKVFFSIERVGN